jgi:hypothetical protein
MSTQDTITSIRPLGPWEAVFHYYEQRYPCQFCLAAEIRPAISPEALADALEALQDVHPLLRASVGSDADGTVMFRRGNGAIPLRTHVAQTCWEDVAAQVQADPIDPSQAPLIRADLVTRVQTSMLVLTFDHRIADGAAGLRALEDLVALLNGRTLRERPVPAPQEALIDALPGSADASGPIPVGDPRLTVASRTRRLDGSRPDVSTVEFGEASTAQLTRACRDHGVTVHAALCAAATQALNAAGRDFVRIVTPKDLRRNIGLSDDVALRLMPSRTGFAREDSGDFWRLARDTVDELAPTRTVEGVKLASAAIAAHPAHSAQEAEDGMLAASSLDMMVTNLGRIELGRTGPIEVSAIYGLAMVVHLVGEQILGVITYRGRLRMTNTTHDPVPGLLPAIVERLQGAVQA